MDATRSVCEAELLSCVLRPAARVLEALQERGMTHRGIRLDNVFQSGPGQSVVLGTAWTAPPAMAQPALFEPPYSAMCLASGRGDGSIGDDVYALGVLLLCLAMGRPPLEQLDDASIIRRKLELGTYAALAGDERLPPVIGDLVRGMLAEDPEHRPSPTLLLDPARARGRRVAARPPRRAQRPMAVGGADVWDARSLALALTRGSRMRDCRRCAAALLSSGCAGASGMPRSRAGLRT
jgi:eukaryotic-like serine/threonine-protein kinase